MDKNVEDYKVSRFILREDPSRTDFVFDDIFRNHNWTSRPFEYRWCENFVFPQDVVLDAASGICHPLKFFLAGTCREVHACDIDPRILSLQEIRRDVSDVFGPAALTHVPDTLMEKITYQQCRLTDMNYSEKMFDKIFCISVLEHLDDAFKKALIPFRFGRWLPFLKRDIFLSLQEFKRILKDDGLMVLTFDYPRVHLRYLMDVLQELSLKPIGPLEMDLDGRALHAPEKKLYFFRLAVAKC